jgi:protein-tyrosine phosphatase
MHDDGVRSAGSGHASLTGETSVSAAVRVCFVCLGNICRSPAAEAVLRQLLDEAGLADLVEVDSAGTSRYHLGDRPDPRTLAEAARRGIPVDHRARQLTRDELREWDLIIAMDAHNLRDLRALAAGNGHGDRLHLLRSFDPAVGEAGLAPPDVPDPYYGDDAEFSEMYDLIEPACRGLVEHLQTLVVRP